MKINFQEEPFKSIKNIKVTDVLDFHSVLLNNQENEIQLKRLESLSNFIFAVLQYSHDDNILGCDISVSEIFIFRLESNNKTLINFRII